MKRAKPISIMTVMLTLGVRIACGAGSPTPPVNLQDHYDIVIAGAGTGGTCCAIQAARMGASVLLLEETDWIGGQMNAAAVTSMDEVSAILGQSGIYRELCERVRSRYGAIGKSPNTAYMRHVLAPEPRVGQQILYAMIADARKHAPLDVMLRSTVTKVIKKGETVTGVGVQVFMPRGGFSRAVSCRLLVDATEWGDVIPLTGARYRVGNCISGSIQPDRQIQSLTWTAVIKQYPRGVPAALRITTAPPGYTEDVRDRFAQTLRAGDTVQENAFDPKTRPWTFATFVAYRGMPDSASAHDAPPITRTHLNFNNDQEASIRDVEDLASRKKTCREGQLKTLHLLYYIQHKLGKTDWSVADDEGFDTPYNRACVDAWIKDMPALEPYRAILNHFSIIAYARESRRIIGIHTLAAREIERMPKAPIRFPDTVTLGDYSVDLHGSQTPALLELDLDPKGDIPENFGVRGHGPFTIPFGCFIPEKLDGFLPAEKNISQSRLANGATRLQPSTMLMGQAAGAMAALAVKHNVQPRKLDPVLVQRALLDAGCLLFITPLRDVARDSREWTAVQLTTVHGMLQPTIGWFGPEKPVSIAQLSEVKRLLFAKEPGQTPKADPVTRAAFAAALEEGMRETPVKLRFVSSGAGQARPITRSEAAQVIAEYLELRASARMTGAARTLEWTSLRPATAPPAADLTASLLGPGERWWMAGHRDFRDWWNPAPVQSGSP